MGICLTVTFHIQFWRFDLVNFMLTAKKDLILKKFITVLVSPNENAYFGLMDTIMVISTWACACHISFSPIH